MKNGVMILQSELTKKMWLYCEIFFFRSFTLVSKASCDFVRYITERPTKQKNDTSGKSQQGPQVNQQPCEFT